MVLEQERLTSISSARSEMNVLQDSNAMGNTPALTVPHACAYSALLCACMACLHSAEGQYHTGALNSTSTFSLKTLLLKCLPSLIRIFLFFSASCPFTNMLHNNNDPHTNPKQPLFVSVWSHCTPKVQWLKISIHF